MVTVLWISESISEPKLEAACRQFDREWVSSVYAYTLHSFFRQDSLPYLSIAAAFVSQQTFEKLNSETESEVDMATLKPMSYFRITLMRSAIGLPAKSSNVLKALGLRKRMATVFHPVSPAVAGQIMKVKELVDVKEVDEPLTKREVHLQRKPDTGFYIEKRASDALVEGS